MRAKHLAALSSALAIVWGGALAQGSPKDAPKGFRFARIVGEMPAAHQPEPSKIPGSFVFDAKTRQSNELIIRLNDRNPARAASLLPGLMPSAPPPVAERAFVAAVAQGQGTGSPVLQAALGQPLHARYVINENRMPDAKREELSRFTDQDRANGIDYHPRERLERYIVLRYSTVDAAQKAKAILEKDTIFAIVQNNGVATWSTAPNDPYFSNNGIPSQYQWGMHAMNFPNAWNKVKGYSYIGLLDAAFPGETSGGYGQPVNFYPNSDLLDNFRLQLSDPLDLNDSNMANHTFHVAGIIGAKHNNGIGVAGACPECSMAAFPTATISFNFQDVSTVASKLTSAVDVGMQIINYSGGYPQGDCSNEAMVLCDALYHAKDRSVLVIVAAGNNNNIGQYFAFRPQFPGNLHDGSLYNYPVLPVGGSHWNGQRWDDGCNAAECGSNWSSRFGVMAPAKNIPSTFQPGTEYNAEVKCSDLAGNDLSAPRFANGVGDGVGSCTGTSMSAPHISGLAGLLRSVNPRNTADVIRDQIRKSGSRANDVTEESGFGVPNASIAVDIALNSNPNRLTPLFSYFSEDRSDSFYTTAPQMARAAVEGYLRPHAQNNLGTYSAAYGNWISNYKLPNMQAVWGGSMKYNVRAEVWIFTTHHNPKSFNIDLEPIYRMSWKCGDPTNYPASICGSKPGHIDTVLVQKSEIEAFQSILGYKIDGIEGYVYPKTIPQPPGTVRLMRMFNPLKDDHAVFPESAFLGMYNNGWSDWSGDSDWLGYVYPNTNGLMPVIQ